ncbi:hypothetical protein [Noviherbaspirillum denitrificans]|uniref:Uncharacterized protein n=1 Tax=Noviherbaspirillum denitrificans TaxID=1968433 RepID=A0A254TJJ2_9BURK|nr:hypothetical protein [Noviherbaspirillum denitrificans]OWW20763.1 hypothetical protein AYR66_16070 [Noviherbaspirillum denitrificans]
MKTTHELTITKFPDMALLSRTKKGGSAVLWRNLCTTDDTMYVMPVHIGKAPKNGQPIVEWSLREVKGLFGSVIQQIPEVVCPSQMLAEQQTEEQKNAIGFKWMLTFTEN